MKRKAAAVTERDIQRAIRQFWLAGGHIQHIPDQVTPHHDIVASRSARFDGWTDPSVLGPLPVEDIRPVVD